MEGETRITHDSGRFISESEFMLHFEYPELFYHKLEMPQILSDDLTVWKSMIKVSGLMEGKAYILNNYIIFIYQSADGHYSGVENNVRVNDNYYLNTGILFRQEVRLSSWKTEMIRIV